MITDQEILETFVNTKLEEDYNFLQADLILLARRFIEKAAPAIAKAERKECIKFVKSLNALVAEKLEEKRGPM